MITERIKDFRIIKEPESIGLCACFSDMMSPASETSDRRKMKRKLGDNHPKFCPKDGIHSKRLKNATTNKVPQRSKFSIFFGEKYVLGWVIKHKIRKNTDISTQTHIRTLQFHT